MRDIRNAFKQSIKFSLHGGQFFIDRDKSCADASGLVN